MFANENLTLLTVAEQEVGHLRKINAPIEQEGLFEGF